MSEDNSDQSLQRDQATVHVPTGANTEIPTLRLKAGAHKRVRNGHPWVFQDELTERPAIAAGSVVRVCTDYDYDLGLGFYNAHSQIVVRLLATQQVDQAWFEQRLRQAMQLRERLFAPECSYRLVFGESDFLPGLIVDRYGDYLALQMLSAGMDRQRDAIVNALRSVLPEVKGIIAKNDSQLRVREGLPRNTELLYGSIPEHIEMTENGLRFDLSLEAGQKTGYFLDQRLNRQFVKTLSKGLRVLDCFTNQGGFALHAASGGAVDVLGVDSSEQAIAASQRNASLNGLAQCRFEEADVFDFLKAQAAQGAQWDVVILDPPAFTKSKAQIPQAKRGYAEINRQALKLIPAGGYLVSASCSHHISESMLLDIVADEARRINRKLKLVHRGEQSPCHPILLTMPETNYLKFLVFEVW